MQLIHGTAPSVEVMVSARTDVGRSRDHNEDRFLVADLTSQDTSLGAAGRRFTLGPKGCLLLVADGMGGAQGGEIASQMAVDLIYERLSKTWANDADSSVEVFGSRVREAVENANTLIHERSKRSDELRGMGSTATVAGIHDGSILVSQVGDSRAYLIRNGSAVQLTHDQSFVQRLVDTGRITEDEASRMPTKNLILQALGPSSTLEVVETRHPLLRGDTALLCSDGLSGVVEAAEIATVVAEEDDLSTACQRLVDLSNERGGPDNITVVMARVTGNGLTPPEEVSPGDQPEVAS